jgi:hypothetical protein
MEMGETGEKCKGSQLADFESFPHGHAKMPGEDPPAEKIKNCKERKSFM